MKLLSPAVVLTATVILLFGLEEVVGKRRFKYNHINCRPGYMVQYKMTVHTLWSKEDFPKMYPLYRPQAQWSTLVGRTHGPGYSMWEEGVNATKEVRIFAEEGNSKYLDAESKQGYKDILDTFTAPPILRGVGATSAMINLDGDHTQLSFIMRIVPSPDWFIGLSSEDLCANGRWRKKVSLNLQPMDAGTDQGLTFTSPNWPHEPYVPISVITNLEPDHPANPFYYPEYEELPVLATVELELLTQYRLRRTFSEIEEISEEVTSTPEDKTEETTEMTSVASTQTETPTREPTTEDTSTSRFMELSTAAFKKSNMMRSLMTSSMGAAHKRTYTADGEPISDVSALSVAEPQFAEVAEALPSPERVSKVTHCEVTEWSEWTACSQSCGFGKRLRFREVVSMPSNGGANCPRLRVEELCGSMRTCKWSHFSFLNKKGSNSKRQRSSRGRRNRMRY